LIGDHVVAPRANWKGFLKVAELSCPIALYTAASTSERIALHTVNRETGHRLRRQYVDKETGDPVQAEQQVKGYEVSKGEYVVIEPEEIAAALPQSDKVLEVQAFIPCGAIDDVYFDRPYYLGPTSPIAEQAFGIIREGMQAKQVAALARAVLFRRVRSVLIRAQGSGLIATTLHFDYEVRSAKEAFAEASEIKIQGEMLDLAKYIIETKKGKFDPSKFDDRYEAALADLVRAKLDGKPIKPREPPATTKVVDLMEALRVSARGKSVAQKASHEKKKGASSGSGQNKTAAGKAKTAGVKTKRKASGAVPRRKAG
jgi:DNA end-binding protein Ku